jgi:RNA polymerase sigma-70 factor, ECF subfamily
MLTLLPRLRRFAIGLTGSTADGDDLVQATFERAIRYIDTWEAGTRLDSWMFRIARNLFLNDIRAQKVRSRHLKTVETEGNFQSDTGDTLDQRLLLGTLRRLIGRLPEEQRAALLLVAVEGLSYAETAEVLDLPVGTVTSRVARARLALKQLIDGAAVVASERLVSADD